MKSRLFKLGFWLVLSLVLVFLVAGMPGVVSQADKNSGADLHTALAPSGGVQASSTITITKATPLDGETGAWSSFGFAAGTAGDVNDDGYADVVVGAPGYGATGRAYVYYGSGSGLSAAHVLTLTGISGHNTNFGHQVSAAGDVNNDGYGDALIGDHSVREVYVYHGSGSGLSATPAVTLTSTVWEFADTLGTAGDVNGDGYDDVIVGARDSDQAFLYYGSASGLAATPSLTLTETSASYEFGWGVGAAGDVNGDGYSDVLVSAYDWSGSQTGVVYVYYGSASGLSATPALHLGDWFPFEHFGDSFSTAGDVDGDGYDDVVVGADAIDEAYIYLGSASGVTTTPALTLTSTSAAFIDFGAAVGTAGDLDSDGFADVIIGGGYSGDMAFVYYGGPSGLSATPALTLTETGPNFGAVVGAAGDVNNDNFADLLVSASGYSGGDGRVYVYHGYGSDPIIPDEDDPQPDPTLTPVIITEDDNGQSFTINPGEFAQIELVAHPSVGGGWRVGENSGLGGDGQPIFRQAATLYSTDSYTDVVGGPVTQTFRFYPLQAGVSTVTLLYDEASSSDTKTVTVQLTAQGSFGAFHIPSDDPPDTAIAPFFSAQEQINSYGAQAQANQANVLLGPLAPNALPSQFNWCDQGGCTPIKNQHSCGSCWAFAINGVMESAIQIKDGVEKDLSEQFLVSCSEYDSGCSGGGSYGFNYYKDKAVQGSGPGVVYEADYPYQGQDTACPGGLTHHETIVDSQEMSKWDWVNWKLIQPSINEIKQAIQQYGPVKAPVCVGDAFQDYQSGIFDTNEKADCKSESGTNHAIVLTGWDDTEGVWYLRNSWGTWWGEDGYMRIKYGVSNVGHSAAYVIYGDDSGVTVPKPPTNLEASVSGNTVTLNWTDNSDNETGFEIQRAIVLGSFATITTVTADTITYDDSGVCNTMYAYKVRAVNAQGNSEFSNLSNMVTTDGCAGLATPTDVIAKGLNNQVRLSWTNPNAGSDGVEITRWNGAVWVKLDMVSDSNTFIDEQNLERGQTYSYQLRVVKGTDHSNFSDPVSAALASISINSPANLSATAVGIGTIALSWSNESTIADKIIIERLNDNTKKWEQIAIVDAATSTYNDTGLSCKAYSYQVAAQVEGDMSNYSNLAQDTVSNCNYFIYLPLVMRNWSSTTPATYSIAGTVTDNGSALAGVTVSDGAGHTATTDANGAYTLSGLSAGTYTITPAKAGYTFSPVSRAVTVPPNATVGGFQGTATTISTDRLVVFEGWWPSGAT